MEEGVSVAPHPALWEEDGWFVDVGILGCDAVLTCRYVPTFLGNILFLSSGLNLEVLRSSKTLISIHKSSLRRNPEDQHQYIHPRENLRSHLSELSLMARALI